MNNLNIRYDDIIFAHRLPTWLFTACPIARTWHFSYYILFFNHYWSTKYNKIVIIRRHRGIPVKIGHEKSVQYVMDYFFLIDSRGVPYNVRIPCAQVIVVKLYADNGGAIHDHYDHTPTTHISLCKKKNIVDVQYRYLRSVQDFPDCNLGKSTVHVIWKK